MVRYSVYLTPEARLAIRNIYNYYYLHISRQMAKNITKGIRKDIKLLAKQPYLGKVETRGTSTFYVLISVNYKIIYTVSANELQIVIVEVFDSRQNPSKLNP